MSISIIKDSAGTSHYIVANGITYCTCSTAADVAEKVATVASGRFALLTGATVVVKFTYANSVASPTLNVANTGAKPIYCYGTTKASTGTTTTGWVAGAVQMFTYDGTGWVRDYWNNTTYSAATTSAAGLMSAADKTKLNGIATGANAYTLPAATSSTLGGVKIGSNISVSSGTISVPVGDKDTAGVTIVYPAASCTTFSSDSGTVSPAAVQKGAKMFAITRPPKKTSSDPVGGGGDTSVTVNAILRWEDTDGDVKNSKITIEDVTNTKDTSKKANVLVIPAEGGKKMVYGYCTDQVDGTSFIGGVFDASATSYPYASGLAIGGTSGNLLWKGKRVLDSDDLTDVTTSISGKANSSHTHPASQITAGTLAGQVKANATAVATVTASQVRNIKASPTDLTAGTSELATGDIYLVYE